MNDKSTQHLVQKMNFSRKKKEGAMRDYAKEIKSYLSQQNNANTFFYMEMNLNKQVNKDYKSDFNHIRNLSTVRDVLK